MKKSISLISFLILLLSCSDKTETLYDWSEEKKKQKLIDEAYQEIQRKRDSIKILKSNPQYYGNDFLEKYNSSKKFLLKFWFGMTKNEYQAVVNILLYKNKLKENSSKETLFFNSAELVPVFKNNNSTNTLKLVELSLLNCSKTLYEKYQKKYSFPRLISVNPIKKGYVENNPDYKPIKMIISANSTISLPDFFIDNTKPLPQGKKYSLKKAKCNQFISCYCKEDLIIPLDKVELMRGDSCVLFVENYYKRALNSDISKYSLENKREMKEYYSLSPSESFFDYFDRKLIPRKYLKLNSVLREVYFLEHQGIKIIYRDLLYNESLTEKINYYKQKADSLNELKRKENESILNEI